MRAPNPHSERSRFHFVLSRAEMRLQDPRVHSFVSHAASQKAHARRLRAEIARLSKQDPPQTWLIEAMAAGAGALEAEAIAVKAIASKL